MKNNMYNYRDSSKSHGLYDLSDDNGVNETNRLILALKTDILMRKKLLVRSEFWNYMSICLKRHIIREWEGLNTHIEQNVISKDPGLNSNIVLFVIGLGSLEKRKESNCSPLFQLAATLALNENISIESIYFCDPEFTFIDSYLIFELFMTHRTHIEVFTGGDLSTPLNTVISQYKNDIYGRDRKPNFLFFMPHCERCTFGMLLHYFSFGKGKDLYIKNNTKIIVWGNNLNTFKIDSYKNFNKNCEYCNLLSSILEKMSFKIENPDDNYNSAFNYAFSDLTIYNLPV
ncbi:hypothetical protein FG386_000322 [Cryptosporidium ryanae]|uniref:uncharacterized protein n=1 Tax=Cryptosporidium ryanae TaxID=515981 RepID=UPI003519FBF5|nr:hypothetical protein FG386_000322 [Cryptosporidium ryanae]